MGGTGKTPITLSLAKYCSETLAKRTAIILRGYKRKSKGYLLVSNGYQILESVEGSGDEAQLYAQELQGTIVICDEDRVRGAESAMQLGAEIILLDDGFQHIRLQRDLNILLINAEVDIPAVLPFGKGRESNSAIEDADIVILTNYNNNRNSFTTDKPVVHTQTALTKITVYFDKKEFDISPETFSKKRILALSGIAHPEIFERSLSLVSSTVTSCRREDHAEYNPAVLEKVIIMAKKNECEYIATTTKDAVKLLSLYKTLQQKDISLPPLAVIHSSVKFMHGEEILFNKINNLFKN
jgi:tetraacyldisaccharide 4'-kinase